MDLSLPLVSPSQPPLWLRASAAELIALLTSDSLKGRSRRYSLKVASQFASADAIPNAVSVTTSNKNFLGSAPAELVNGFLPTSTLNRSARQSALRQPEEKPGRCQRSISLGKLENVSKWVLCVALDTARIVKPLYGLPAGRP